MIGSDDIMIIGTQLSNNEHIVRTTQQWQSSAVKYKIIPRGCVCVELTSDGKTRVKIGEGNKYYEQLPYVDADIDMEEITHIVEEYLQYYATTEYVDTKVDVVDKKVDKLDEDVASLEETVDKYDERITTVENEISTCDERITTVENEVSAYDNRIDSLEEKAHTHDNKSILDNTTASFTISDETKLDGIEDNANNYSLPKASSSTLGGIKVGDNLSIDNDGVLSANPGGYTLPPATDSTLGGIIVGNNLTITPQGVLSANSGGYTLPIASDQTLGGIKVGENLNIDSTTGVLDAIDTVYTLPSATEQILGGVKIGNRLSIDSSGVLSADDQSYTLPKASDTTLGGVKIDGHNLSIDNDGVLYATDTNTEYDAGTGIRIDTPVSGNDEIVNTGVLDVTKNSSGNLVISKESGDSTITLPQEYVLPSATSSTLGGVKIGNNINVDANGVISVDDPPAPYSLPIASDQTLGGIKVGNNLTIDPVTGVLDATGGSSITVDDHLDDQSTNPVQNAVLTPILEGLNTRIHEITANDVDLWWDMEDNRSGVIIGNAVVVVEGVITPTPEIGSAETVTE
jgi:prefoldin subunit 5